MGTGGVRHRLQASTLIADHQYLADRTTLLVAVHYGRQRMQDTTCGKACSEQLAEPTSRYGSAINLMVPQLLTCCEPLDHLV
jgi:hypothetical protein